MYSIVLSDEEISQIKSFINEASNIPVVECIYILPFLDPETNKEIIDVIAIFDDSLYYNKLLTGIEDERDEEDDEIEILSSLIKTNEQQSKDNRLKFHQDYSGDYSLSLMHRREVLSERDIVSGTILFDRFGYMSKNKKDASKYLLKVTNLLQIENMDQLTNDNKDVIKLQKKNKHES